MRCDGGSIWKLSDCECFNPHTYMRCDRMPSFRWHLHICFNPHTYMRCDPRFFISLLMSRSFNPHTYMRCDRAGNSLTTWLTVSIHTPTWGVTISSWTISVGKEFQSTHLHEVWRQRSLHIPPTISFNPHTYMRCDKHYANLPTYNKVSIHTPTWGVTVVITTGVDPVSFNPHTYMRCDLFAWIWGMVETSFNPHTYMRCDNRGKTVCWYDRVSIHTPTWGVTANSMNYKINQMFQSTHLHEVWPIWITEVSNDFQSFNPHTYMRCDSMFPVMFPLR